jgi:menaquinone-dependent protoporphyrinogen oxidase
VAFAFSPGGDFVHERQAIMSTSITVPVFYATTDGHTRRIAEQIASTLRQQGLDSEARDLSAPLPPIDWLNIHGVVLGAPIYAGRHQKVAEDFATAEARHLAVRPSAFFSVSLSAGSRKPAEVEAARALARGFVKAAGWEPRRVECFAGKLAYSRYGFFKRQIMRYIAWREGAPTDARRDYEFTDWAAVRRFALEVAGDVFHSGRSAAVRRAV